MQYKPHEQRVIVEQSDLNEKITKLVDFICTSPIFEGLSDEDAYLLRLQRDAMLRYSDILAMRISKFER